MRIRMMIRRRLRFRLHSFLEIDCEIFSTVILSSPLTQEGQLSVSGKLMCMINGKPLRGLSLARKNMFL